MCNWLRVCWASNMFNNLKKYKTIGFDTNKKRIYNLQKHKDEK